MTQLPELRIEAYHVDAFSNQVFGGNAAIVCCLDDWPADKILQAITAEHGRYTAFFSPDGDEYRLRWFVPAGELELCGHATLATAHVILQYREPARKAIRFHTRAGILTASLAEDVVEIELPAFTSEPIPDFESIASALGARPALAARALDALALFDHEDEVRNLAPNMDALAALDVRGVAATAPATDGDADYVLRFFAPDAGIPEDPATASVQGMLAPFWSARLGRDRLVARQLSPRGGELICTPKGDRVGVAGRAVTFSVGTIAL